MGLTEPICVVCDQPIRGREERVTVQGEPHHGRCWEREQTESNIAY